MIERGQYGNWYYGIRLDDGNETEVNVHGDELEFKDGSLIVWRIKDDGTRLVNVAFAPGQWAYLFAASLLDGHAVAVEHWCQTIGDPAATSHPFTTDEETD
ncbi:hypothetical protein ADL00_17260 [Streptomyces sp. AS58]|uniref:hypothetical protein n=1 Tax=Streptomyces sp. AS58 TaxID=1519489 RepID=UPI0006AECAF8|nr:hypothetical protein [Streptomyces sp. AS58]KOV66567.1 hypothetical protein ADL00_17260 [Streptomyces sp. AS58]